MRSFERRAPRGIVTDLTVRKQEKGDLELVLQREDIEKLIETLQPDLEYIDGRVRLKPRHG